MKVRIDKIKIDKKNRLRYSSGKSVDDLKDSIGELGLIHPIVVNEAYKLLAGYRRLKAAKELGWKEIDVNIVRNLTKLEEFDIELHENWKRQNFTDYELAEALEKRKLIIEKEYPEVKKGAYMKEERESGQKQLPKKTIITNFGNIDSSEEKSDKKVRPIERPTKSAAKILGVSEATVQTHHQALDIIKEEKVPKEIAEKYKKGESKSYEIVKHFRKLKKEKKEDKKPKKVIEDSVEQNEEKKLCSECKMVEVITCPYCGKIFYNCREKGFRKVNVEVCDKFVL